MCVEISSKVLKVNFLDCLQVRQLKGEGPEYLKVRRTKVFVNGIEGWYRRTTKAVSELDLGTVRLRAVEYFERNYKK